MVGGLGLGSREAWRSYGLLVERVAESPSPDEGRAAVIDWLERTSAVSMAFIGRAAAPGSDPGTARDAPPDVVAPEIDLGYARNVSSEIQTQFFAERAYFAPSVAWHHERIARDGVGGLARETTLDDLVARRDRVGVDILAPLKMPRVVLARACVGSQMVAACYLGCGARPNLGAVAQAMPVLAAIEVLHGRASLPALAPDAPAPAAEPAPAPQAARGKCLTDRERQVLAYAARGHTNHQIAHELGTSANTVKRQISSMLARLGASTRAEAVRYAMLEGFLPR